MDISAQIERKLKSAFSPSLLEVINESHLHAGHAGDNGSGNSHFRIRIIAADFAGQSRVAQHRAVNEVLSEELSGPVHALALEIKSE